MTQLNILSPKVITTAEIVHLDSAQNHFCPKFFPMKYLFDYQVTT